MQHRHFLLAALSALLCLAMPAAAQQAPVEKDAPAEGASVSEEALLAAAEEIAQDVAEIRGLEVMGPVKKGIKQRDELRAVLISKLAEEIEDEDIEAEAAVFKRLGVIPQDLDYKKVLLDVLTEQIAGFYDQTTKELYIMEGIPLSLQRPAMAHELFHAIQDQHFDILSMQEPFSTMENSDFALARSALIEGDATVLMFDFSLYEAGTLPQEGATSLVDIPVAANLLRNLEFNDITALEQLAGTFGGAGFDIGDSALSRAPAIFRESLMFPYFAGMRFVVMARSGRTWADIDRIYENPPVSTEQILHPERYFAGDDPQHVDFQSDQALADWKPIYDSVIGEFQMLQILKAHVPDLSGGAAKGWDGDRMRAYRNNDTGSTAVVFLSTWDGIGEAGEFYEAAVAAAEKRYPEATPVGSVGKYGESTCLVIGPQDARERLYVERWGDMVLYVEGTPSKLDADGKETDPTTHQLRQLVWKTQQRAPFSQHMKEVLARKSAQKKAEKPTPKKK